MDVRGVAIGDVGYAMDGYGASIAASDVIIFTGRGIIGACALVILCGRTGLDAVGRFIGLTGAGLGCGRVGLGGDPGFALAYLASWWGSVGDS